MRTLLLSLSLFLICGTMRAEIRCGLTLELLADTCPYIGIYTYKDASSSAFNMLSVKASLQDTLRGTLPDDVSFMYPGPSSEGRVAVPGLQKGGKFLVFLRDAGKNDVRLEEVIGLTNPIKAGDLSAALEPDFTVLSDGNAIEKVVKSRIAKKALTPALWREYPDNRFRLPIPPGTAAYRAVFGGSSCYLIVPDDLLAISEAQRSK